MFHRLSFHVGRAECFNAYHQHSGALRHVFLLPAGGDGPPFSKVSLVETILDRFTDDPIYMHRSARNDAVHLRLRFPENLLLVCSRSIDDVPSTL